MAVFEVTQPDGRVFEVTTPDAAPTAAERIAESRPTFEPSTLTRGAAFAARVVPPVIAAPFGPLASAAAGAAGETIGQGIELATGTRDAFSIGSVGVAAASSAIPLKKLAVGTSALKRIFARTAQGGAEGAVVTAATDVFEGRGFQPKRVAIGAGIGATAGAVLGGAEHKVITPRKADAFTPEAATKGDAVSDAAVATSPLTPPVARADVSGPELKKDSFMAAITDEPGPPPAFVPGSPRRASRERVEAVFGTLPPANKSILSDVFDRNADLIDYAARGRISDEARSALASHMAPRLGAKLARGETLSAEAQESVLTSSSRLVDEIFELGTRRAALVKAGDAGGEAAGLGATIAQKHSDLGLLVTAATSSASEAARTLRTQRMLGTTTHGRAVQAAGKLRRDLKKLHGGTVPPSADDLTAAVMLLQREGTDGVEARKAFSDLLLDLTQPTTAQRYGALLKSSLLFRGGSHARNVVGNVYSLAESVATLPLAVSKDMGRVAQTGGTREVFMSEGKGVFTGMWLGAKEGLAMIRKGIGHSDIGDSTTLIEKLRKGGLEGARTELAPINAALRFKSPIINVALAPARASSWALQTADTFMQSVTRGVHRQRLAIAAAKREGLSGPAAVERIADLTHKPTDAMLAIERVLGERSTFQELPDAITTKILKGKSWLARQKGAGPQGLSMALETTVPFIRTPSNILRRGMLHTPGLGEVVRRSEIERLIKSAAGGDPALAAQIRNRITAEITGESVAGVALLAPLVMLYASGRITGAAPSDPIDRDLFYREGKLPNAVRLGDKWVKIATIAPQLSLPASVVANTVEMYRRSVREGYKPDLGSLAVMALTESGKSTMEASYFEGIERMMQLVGETFAAPKIEGRMDALAGFGGQVAGSFVPGVVSEVASALDPVVRDPSTIVEGVQRGLPFLSESVPARMTGRGEPARKYTAIPGFGDTSVAQPQDPLDNLLTTLRAQGFDVGVRPPRDNRSIQLPDDATSAMVGVDLKPEEALTANVASARFATRQMQEVMKIPNFRGLPPAHQARVLNIAKDRAQKLVAKIAQVTAMEGKPITESAFAQLVK